MNAIAEIYKMSMVTGSGLSRVWKEAGFRTLAPKVEFQFLEELLRDLELRCLDLGRNM